MAVDVRLTTRQATALFEVVAAVEANQRAFGIDGHVLRVLRNAALRIGAAVTLGLPPSPQSAVARGICLRGLIAQLREIDAEHG